MPLLPTIDYAVISALFSIVLLSLGIVWGVNKAIIIAKSH